jgi:hypothetical protein
MIENKALNLNGISEHTAGNGRFGASGGVARPKFCVILQVLYPAQTTASRRLPPSRWDVRRQQGQCSVNKEIYQL